MFKHVIFWGGLLLAFLLLGHLALNATGVGNNGIERSTGPAAAKTLSAKQPSINASAEELQARAAEEALYRAESRSYLSAERRKELDEAARLAGIDPNLIGSYSDSELIDALRNMPSTSKSAANAPDVVASSKDDPEVAKAMLELQDVEALKRSLEAEAGVASVPGASGSTLPGASGSTLRGEEQKAALEVLESAPAGVEMPEYQPAPIEEAPASVTTESSSIEVILQRMDAGEQLTAAEKDILNRYLESQPAPDRGHGSLDNTGGPDAYGYRFTDNVAPDDTLITYSWIELRGDASATLINSWYSHDDGYSYVGATYPGARHPIGFSFPFYGVLHDSFRVTTNGFIQFTTTATSLTNAVLPSTSVAGPAIFVYWDDLHLDRNGQTVDQVMYRNFGTYTVIEYDSIGVYNSSCGAGGPTNTLKMEVILFNNGKIKIQYNTIAVCDAQDSSMTVGIQATGVAGSPALQYCYGAGTAATWTGFLPVSGRAIEFRPPSYVDNFGTIAITSPLAGVPYGGSRVLSVTATFLNLGSATQTAPVKYQFDGGTVVEETSLELDSLETDPHTFATTITTPTDTGNHPLWVWSDLVDDENRLNDTLKMNVRVFPGGGCESPIVLSGVSPDSAQYNNNGAGDNSPGVPCYANTYNDMVFKKDVLAGHKVAIWVSSLSWSSKYINAALRWSGNCPGDSLVKCISYVSTAGPTGYNQKFIWTNMTGSTQTVYFTIGAYYSGVSYTGNFKLAWKDTEYEHDFSVTAITSPLTSAYVPSQVVTVTGTAINLGTTEESSPIKYKFISGDSLVEATASLVRFATESHAFATQITLPGTNGNYSLWVYTDLATDEDRTNDTTKMTVKVFGGNNCTTVFELTTNGPDSTTLNNCGADSNNPGGPCYPTYFYSDMVVKKNVAAGRTITFWVSSMSASSKYIVASMRWGGACPGTNHVVCPPYSSSAPGINRQHMWTNTTGSTQTVYFTFGNYYGSSSYCGNIKLAWKDELCAAVDPPVTEGFEGSPAHMYKLPSCWTREDANGLSPIWECYTTYPRTGIYDVSISYLAAGNNDWLFTPGINMEEGRDYFLTYWRRVGSASYPDSIEVMAGLAPTAAAMNISVCATDTCQRAVYVQKFGGFTCPASGVYYIGWHSMTMSTSNRTYIDDINIDASTSCTGGTVTVNSAIGADSVTLNAQLGGGWSGGVPRYQWYAGDTCANGNQVPGATTANYKTYASGNFSCRVYIVDSLTCVACDSGTATVVDCWTPVAPPIQEGFENVTAPALPVCWTQQDVNADGRPWVTQTGTTYAHSGTQNGWNTYSTGTATNDWLFSRALLLSSGTNYYCDYWYRCYLASTSYTEALEVVAGTTRTPGGMPIIIDTNFTFSNVSVYTLRARAFTVAETDTYYIAWHAGGGINQGGVLVDDIAIYTDNDCIAPSLTVNAATGADSARLKALAVGGLPSQVFYQWYIGDTCDPENEIEGATTDSLWVFVSGSYACKAWCGNEELCSDCDSGYADVIDCDIPLTLPITEGFEGTTGTLLPVCWTKLDVNADARTWATIASTSYARSPSLRCAYNTYSSVTAANDWMFSRGVGLTEGDTVVVDYWYRCYLSSSSYWESLELLVGTAPDVVSMTTIVDTNFQFQLVTTYTLRSGLFVVPATGTYYFGWHAGYLINQGGVCIDDIAIYEYGNCAPPVVDVPSVASQVYVTLTCGVTGGLGGPIQYQWYTGDTCLAENEIGGATGRQYTTFTSGNFSCMAWFVSPDTCSDCDSATATVVPDPCLPGGVPPIFEPWANASLPTCWSQENGNNDSYSWSYSSSYYVSSPYSAYLYTSTTPANDWLFSGPVQLTLDSTYRISFWRRASSASYAQTLSLFVGTNRHSSAMTTTLLAPYTFTNLVFVQDVAEYTAPATGSYYFSLRNTTSVSSGSVYADDFRIFKVGSCGAPTTVTVNSTSGPDVATLTCNASGGFGGPTQYQWYTEDLCNPLNEIVGATNQSYDATVSGIYSCKAYYVSADTCGGCDSAIATVIVCAPDPYDDWPNPFTEGFETTTGTALPDCWGVIDVNNDARPWRTNTSYPRTGLRYAYNMYSTGTATDDWMFSRPISLTAGDTMDVVYWYRCSIASTSYWESLELLVGTSPSVVAMTTIVDTNFTFSNVATYTERTGTFVVPSTGNYYYGWHAGYLINQGGVCVDDITIYKRGTCIAPTLADIPAVVYPAWVTLTANASGGFGSPIQYQWYTGFDCAWDNRIIGATTYQYTTSVSGIFSCRASRDTCGVCDSAEVTITAPQPGEICSNALTLAPPAHNDSSWVSGTTDGFYSHCPETCIAGISHSPDVFYKMIIPGSGDSACRRLTFVLRFVSPDTGDPFLVIYDGLANCCNTPLYCNDDDLLFTPLPPWDVPAQHPGWPSSYIAAEFYPGTYLIRVGEWEDSSGAYTLKVYDNGPCYEPCLEPDSLTVTMSPADPTKVWLHFNAPSIGTYKVFSTIQKNNDGNPNMGADLQWTLDTTMEVTTTGRVAWNDLRATVAYRNYAVQHDCPILGRCCYGPEDSLCVNNTLAECQALSGLWNRYVTCESDPCPVGGNGETCETAIYVGSFPYSTGTVSTAGFANDYLLYDDGTNCLSSSQSYYGNGRDVIYRIVLSTTTNLTFSYTQPGWGSLTIHNACPAQGTCIAGTKSTSSETLTIPCRAYSPGTYYAMVDNWPAPDIMDYSLTITTCTP